MTGAGSAAGSARKVALLAIMTALSLVLSFAESFIPMPVPVPGLKIGLANIVIIVLLTGYGLGPVLSVSVARSVLAAFFTGAVTSMMFSLAGGVSSCVAMWLFYRKLGLKLSLIGISIIGALVHNSAQIVVAMLLMRDTAILYYLPALLLFAIPAGFAVGLCGGKISPLSAGLFDWRQT